MMEQDLDHDLVKRITMDEMHVRIFNFIADNNDEDQ
jgi:hypothetical protein